MRWDFGSVARARQPETVIVVHAVCVPDVGSDRRVGRGRRPVPEWAGPALDPDAIRRSPYRRGPHGVITTGAASLALDGEPQVWATRWSLARRNQASRPRRGPWHANFVSARTRISPAGVAPIAGCRGPATRLVVVLARSRRFVPGQAAVVAAVRRRVPGGQGALTFVELPGRGGPAAGHSPIQHPIGRKSTSQSGLFTGRLCTAGPPTKNLPLLSCQQDRATGGTRSASVRGRPAPKPWMASLPAAPEPASSDGRIDSRP